MTTRVLSGRGNTTLKEDGVRRHSLHFQKTIIVARMEVSAHSFNGSIVVLGLVLAISALSIQSCACRGCDHKLLAKWKKRYMCISMIAK